LSSVHCPHPTQIEREHILKSILLNLCVIIDRLHERGHSQAVMQEQGAVGVSAPERASEPVEPSPVRPVCSGRPTATWPARMDIDAVLTQSCTSCRGDTTSQRRLRELAGLPASPDSKSDGRDRRAKHPASVAAERDRNQSSLQRTYEQAVQAGEMEQGWFGGRRKEERGGASATDRRRTKSATSSAPAASAAHSQWYATLFLRVGTVVRHRPSPVTASLLQHSTGARHCCMQSSRRACPVSPRLIERFCLLEVVDFVSKIGEKL